MNKLHENEVTLFSTVSNFKNTALRVKLQKQFIKYELPEELLPQKKLIQLSISGKMRFSSITVSHFFNKNIDYSYKYYKNIHVHVNHMQLNEYLLKKYVDYSYLEQKPIFLPVANEAGEYMHVYKESSTLASIYQLVTRIQLTTNNYTKEIQQIINKLNTNNYKANFILHSKQYIYMFHRLTDNITLLQGIDLYNKHITYLKKKLRLNIDTTFTLNNTVPLIFSISNIDPLTKNKVKEYVNYPVYWNDEYYSPNKLHHFLNQQVKILTKEENIIKANTIKPNKNKYKVKFNLEQYISIIDNIIEHNKSHFIYNVDCIKTLLNFIIKFNYQQCLDKNGNLVCNPHIKQVMITKKFLSKIFKNKTYSDTQMMNMLRYIINCCLLNKENSTLTIQNQEYLQKRNAKHQLAGFFTLPTITQLKEVSKKIRQVEKYTKQYSCSYLNITDYVFAIGYNQVKSNFSITLIWNMFKKKNLTLPIDMANQIDRYYQIKDELEKYADNQHALFIKLGINHNLIDYIESFDIDDKTLLNYLTM